MDQIETSLAAGEPIESFYAHLADPKNGVSGYIYHTVPVAVYAGFQSLKEDTPFHTSLSSVLNMGGDTDTSGAIAGAILGAIHGKDNFPRDWVTGIQDWPRSPRYLSHLCDGLSSSSRIKHVPTLHALIRNALFLVIVLIHGFSRLIPASPMKR